MFCPQCGATLPDNARFCGQCGMTMNNAPAPQTTPQPAYQPSKPVERGNLVTAIARSQTRVIAIIALVALLLCAGLSVADYYIVKSTSLENMPAIFLVEIIADEDFDIDDLLEEAMEEAGFAGDVDDLFDQARDALDQTQVSKKDQESLKNLLDSTEDLLKAPSFGGLQEVASQLDKNVDILDDVQDDLERQLYMGNAHPNTLEDCRVALDAIDGILEASGEVEDITLVVKIIDLVLLGLLLLSLLFILLAGFFRLPGLLVPSILLFLPVVLALGSVVWFAISLVVHILLWVMLAVLNKKHRATQYA